MWDDPVSWAMLGAALVIVLFSGWLMYDFVRDEVEHARYIERRAVITYLRCVADESCDIAAMQQLTDNMRTRESYLASALYDLADEIRDGEHV